MRITWKQAAENAIQEALKTMPPDPDEKVFRAHLSAAYPFGDRSMHPYKVWLGCIKKVVQKHFPEGKKVGQSALERALEIHEEKAIARGFKPL